MREVVVSFESQRAAGNVGFDVGWAAGWSSAPRPRGSRLSLVPVTHGYRAETARNLRPSARTTRRTVPSSGFPPADKAL